MQRVFLVLTLGIAICLQSHACFCASKGGGATTKANDRWSNDADRYWSADLFFDDPKVLELCQAIREKDYEQIDRLVKIEGAEINATGWRNMTPLCWAFPLGFAEARDNIPSDAKDETVITIQREYLGRHARLLEHLLKLGADPNIKTSHNAVAELSKERKSIHVPGVAFAFPKGLAVTHLAAAGYYRGGFTFLPIVMANGGDPNLVGRAGMTPVCIACGGGFGMMYSGGAWAENLAILIEAGADLEIRESDGHTPILVAARGGHSKLVFMLLHTEVDFRVKGKRGSGLVSFARQRQDHIVRKCREYLKEFPDTDWIWHIDPYHLEVAAFLEQHRLLPDGTHAEWKRKLDELVDEYGNVAYSKRDPFVDEWVAKQKTVVKAVLAGRPHPRNAWDYPVYNNWSPKRIFADPKVVELCYAIADEDYAMVERLVKNEGVDINAKGFMDITPLLWAFPLGRLESVHRWHNQGLQPGYEADRAEIRQIEQEVLSRHASFLEKLLKLGANPNVITKKANRSDILGNDKLLVVPGALFPPMKGYSVTRLAARRYGPAEFSYLSIVMANGGDPNLADQTTDATPTARVCGGDVGILGVPRPAPRDLATMIEAHADLELTDRGGNTPILLAARLSRYSMVYMLIHARAKIRVKNAKGKDLVWYARQHKRSIENLSRGPHEVDPYFLEVVGILEEDGMFPKGTHAAWEAEIDKLIRERVRAYGERDPFVDEWVANRKK